MFGGIVQPVNTPVGLMEFFSKETLIGMRSFPLIFPKVSQAGGLNDSLSDIETFKYRTQVVSVNYEKEEKQDEGEARSSPELAVRFSSTNHSGYGGPNGTDVLLHLCNGAALMLKPAGFFIFEPSTRKQGEEERNSGSSAIDFQLGV
ncbi:hypothetical protein CMV_013429 [Castanea mollissima]|uniref:Uncharacterized protein n=1 Tax=Castanea mollissima TaxID=60419 RepID=A0A8J4QZF7_9ROSI|nr:hypothetical protein CMV_013429 [Castanea mollissima]